MSDYLSPEQVAAHLRAVEEEWDEEREAKNEYEALRYEATEWQDNEAPF